MSLDFYPILIIPLLATRITLDIRGCGACSERERGISLSLLRRPDEIGAPRNDKKWGVM
jgi:hypothetical protein